MHQDRENQSDYPFAVPIACAFAKPCPYTGSYAKSCPKPESCPLADAVPKLSA
jgi:hypothetical protein